MEEEMEENVDEPMDDTKDVWLRYQIQNHNIPGPYWNDGDGIGTDGSDKILSMIKNYSDMEPIENYPNIKSKAGPESILSASKSTPNIITQKV